MRATVQCSVFSQADHAWRCWWQQGGFGLLEVAARRHARELRVRELELAKGKRVRFLASGVCSGVAAATVVHRFHAPVVELCDTVRGGGCGW